MCIQQKTTIHVLDPARTETNIQSPQARLHPTRHAVGKP
jgi:hypothetical protein